MEINRFRNFWDCTSAGGDGIFGKFLTDEYEGGVGGIALFDEEVGRKFEGCCCCCCGCCGCCGCCEEVARKLDDDDLSLGDGDAFLDLDLSNSFNLFVLNSPSNCCLKSFAHASSYSPLGPFRSAMLISIVGGDGAVDVVGKGKQ